ncbi:MAG TPA: glycosyltransferase family 39 protein, partial [Bryobacteraceae bacterium]|nr:glycosyltransferase family 39 protein [Bryobacteraceae bacterium]
MRLAALIVALSVTRIVSTYWVFNHVMDEPTHIACGLEWLERHTYTYELLHPPLARVAVAMGPWLLATRNVDGRELPSKNPLVLYNSRSYETTLASARAGQLPFFVAAAFVVFLWARRLEGPLAGVLSLLLFTTLPSILGHAGLATTDMAVAAGVAAALFCLILWLEQPTRARAVLVGFVCALGILTKFTFFLFFPAGAAIILILRPYRKRFPLLTWLKRVALAVLVCFLTVWAGYRFGVTHGPAGEVYLGLREGYEDNLAGRDAYLLGERSSSGWWYFFPVVLFYKTPLPFLALAVAGGILAFRRGRGLWTPFLCAVAMLAVVLPSRINLGVRHVLPVYPLLAITAGCAAAWMLRSQSRAVKAACLLLLAWHGGASALAHPDYTAYFNELAWGEPEWIRVDSDLDWGQNVARLGRRL